MTIGRSQWPNAVCVMLHFTQRKKENGHRFVRMNVGRTPFETGPISNSCQYRAWLIRICNRFCIYFIASPTLISSSIISKQQQQYQCSSSLCNRYGYRRFFYPSEKQRLTKTSQNFTLPWLVRCSMRFDVRDDSVDFSVNRTQSQSQHTVLTTYTAHTVYAPLFWSSMNDTIEVCVCARLFLCSVCTSCAVTLVTHFRTHTNATCTRPE